MHVHARACIFQENDLRSAHLQTLDYHPGKFHVDPSSSFWEHSRTKNGQKEEEEEEPICSHTSFGEHNKKQSKTNMFPHFVWGT